MGPSSLQSQRREGGRGAGQDGRPWGPPGCAVFWERARGCPQSVRQQGGRRWSGRRCHRQGEEVGREGAVWAGWQPWKRPGPPTGPLPGVHPGLALGSPVRGEALREPVQVRRASVAAPGWAPGRSPRVPQGQSRFGAPGSWGLSGSLSGSLGGSLRPVMSVDVRTGRKLERQGRRARAG